MLLQSSTDPRWAETAREDLQKLLSDHLHCERKAAENALALVRRYPDRPELAQPLARLAHEETSHLVQIADLLARRGLKLTHDLGNRYAQALRALVRPAEPARLLDSLVVSAFIEARSHERLRLLGDAFAAAGDVEIADLYRGLAGAEERHHELFVELAGKLCPPAEVAARIAELGAREAEIIAALPRGPRIH